MLTTVVPSILLPNPPAKPCFLLLIPGTADGGKRDEYQAFCSSDGKREEKKEKRPPHAENEIPRSSLVVFHTSLNAAVNIYISPENMADQ